MRNNIKKIFALLLAFFITICACGCDTWNNFKKAFIDPPEEVANVIKIGIFEPLTGRSLYDAKDEIAGFELAHSLYPMALGYKIELVYEDNHSNAEEECAAAAQRLIDDGCSVVLGSVSDLLSIAGSDIFKENKIAAIAATNTNPVLTQSNYYYFRASYINTYDTHGAADYAYNVLKADKCAVIYAANSDFAKEQCEQFESTFVALVGAESFEYQEQVLDQEQALDSNTKTYKTVTSTSPTVKYIAVNSTETEQQLTTIFKDLKKLGYNTIFCPSAPEQALPLIELAYNYTHGITDDVSADGSSDNVDKNTTSGNADADNVATNTDDKKTETATNSSNEDVNAQDTIDQDGFFWIGTDSWETILDVAEEEEYKDLTFLTNTAYTLDYDPDQAESEMATNFINAYKAEYGEDAVPSDAVALGFDAYLLAYNAIIACQTNESGELLTTEQMNKQLFDENGVFTRTGIANNLYKIRNLEAVTGTISIDDNGDPAKDLFIRKFNGKEYNVVYTVHPELTSKESIE